MRHNNRLSTREYSAEPRAFRKSRFVEMFGDKVFDTYALSELCDLFTDGDWIESKDQDKLGTIRLLQTGNVGEGIYLNKVGHSRYINEETFKALDCTEVYPGDILISRLPDPLGRACIVPDGLGRMITAVDCTILRLKSSVLPQYLIGYTMTPWYASQIASHMTGSTRKRISRKNLGSIRVPLPPLTLQREFADFAARVDKLRF